MNIRHHLSATLFLAAIFPSSADVSVSKVFGDHMVLQQGAPIRVWGTADPGEGVSVSLGGKTKKTTTSKEGSWRVDLPSLTADNKPHTMTIKGKNRVEIKDVLLGEVWICSGQSNMEWAVNRSLNPKEEIAAANHPYRQSIDGAGRYAKSLPGSRQKIGAGQRRES